MESLGRLTELFKKFPGIGPRQARRFAYFLLSKDDAYAEALLKAIRDIKKDLIRCGQCGRFISGSLSKSGICAICADRDRDDSILTVVSTDTDLESFERNSEYKGKYFVLGGTIPILEEHPEKIGRIGLFEKFVSERMKSGLREIILALNANPEGEYTAEILTGLLKKITANGDLKISSLGRGLSTGSELEYADAETIKSALKNRS